MAKKPFINKYGFVEYPFLHDSRKSKNWWFWDLLEWIALIRCSTFVLVKIPMIIISGFGRDSSLFKEAMELKPCDHAFKPFSVEQGWVPCLGEAEVTDASSDTECNSRDGGI